MLHARSNCSYLKQKYATCRQDAMRLPTKITDNVCPTTSPPHTSHPSPGRANFRQYIQPKRFDGILCNAVLTNYKSASKTPTFRTNSVNGTHSCTCTSGGRTKTIDCESDSSVWTASQRSAVCHW